MKSIRPICSYVKEGDSFVGEIYNVGGDSQIDEISILLLIKDRVESWFIEKFRLG